jgi:Transposase DDE domain group 1
MVKRQDTPQRSKQQAPEKPKRSERSRPKITANTPVGLCEDRLTAFGGLLALAKMFDLLDFEREFDKHYVAPKRLPKLGHYRMVSGILMLLFIGFQRLGHFAYLRGEVMLCGLLRVPLLPVVTTFWRYLRSLGIGQSASLLNLSGVLRAKVWAQVKYAPKKVEINIDTTTATVYGNIEGSRKGYNPKHRGKKGLRPVLCFLQETREYLCGTQRRGTTISAEEVARQIGQFRGLLPSCVQAVLVRGDGEMIGWESVEACEKEGFSFIFGNKRSEPPFTKKGWYRHGEHEYNGCIHQPIGWKRPIRFVAVRIKEEKAREKQLTLPEMDGYVYRIFATNCSGAPHRVAEEYDLRADVENLIGEAQREGLLAIPSKSFQSHHAFFQIVMLAYNLWRWMKLMAGHCEAKKKPGKTPEKKDRITMPDHTLRIARLKMLFVAARIQYHGHRDVVKYSIHDERTAGLVNFLKYLDRKRLERRRAA